MRTLAQARWLDVLTVQMTQALLVAVVLVAARYSVAGCPLTLTLTQTARVDCVLGLDTRPLTDSVGHWQRAQ